MKNVTVIVNLDELALVGGRATGRRHWWWLEWFAEVCENRPDRARLGDEGDQADVAAARWALERKLLPHPGKISVRIRAGCETSIFGSLTGYSQDRLIRKREARR